MPRLLAYGHGGEEGVLHLLPRDLAARCARTPGRPAVTLVTARAVLARCLAEHPDLLAEFGAPAGEDERVPLLRREPAADVVPAERDGEPQAVLLIDLPGPAASAAEPIAAFEAGEAGTAVLTAQERPGRWRRPVDGVGSRRGRDGSGRCAGRLPGRGGRSGHRRGHRAGGLGAVGADR